MNRGTLIAISSIVLWVSGICLPSDSVPIALEPELEKTVTYNFYVIAGYNTTPAPPFPASSPPNFTITCDPLVCDFGNITKTAGKAWLYQCNHVKVNITNGCGYGITVTNLTAEVTAGTKTLMYWHNWYTPTGAWLYNHSLVFVDVLDLNDDECNYRTGEITSIMHDDDMYTMALGAISYPEEMAVGAASLLKPDQEGDAAETGHVAPLSLANGSTFTEYFDVRIFGDAKKETQINGTITLTLTYTLDEPVIEVPWLWITTGLAATILVVVVIGVANTRRQRNDRTTSPPNIPTTGFPRKLEATLNRPMKKNIVRVRRYCL